MGSLERDSTSSLDVDEELKENHVIHLIRKIRDGPAIEELILVTDIHVDLLREGSVHTDKESVLIKTRLGSSHTDRVQTVFRWTNTSSEATSAHSGAIGSVYAPRSPVLNRTAVPSTCSIHRSSKRVRLVILKESNFRK